MVKNRVAVASSRWRCSLRSWGRFHSLAGAQASEKAGKGADSPGNCATGRRHGEELPDCVPSDSAGDTSGGGGGGDDSDAPKKKPHAKAGGDEDKVGGNTGESASSGGESGSGGGKSYDKDEIDAKMKRSAKQIKSNCGAATDDEGKATGPWGQVHVSIVLGRNGHVKDVAIPCALTTAEAGRHVHLAPFQAFDEDHLRALRRLVRRLDRRGLRDRQAAAGRVVAPVGASNSIRSVAWPTTTTIWSS